MNQSITAAERLRTRLAAHKGRWPQIADASGVPISTVRKIAQGVTPNPRVDTVDRLDRTLDSLEPPSRQ